MLLRELAPVLLVVKQPPPSARYDTVTDVASAHGLQFRCPKCSAAATRDGNHQFAGVHHFLGWTDAVDPEVFPGPRIALSGRTLEDVGVLSVIEMACAARFYVRDGRTSPAD